MRYETLGDVGTSFNDSWNQMTEFIMGSFGVPAHLVGGEKTTGRMLLEDILANPLDDGLRLIYADWLEDNGKPERAEFIRVQIGAAACKTCGGRSHSAGRPGLACLDCLGLRRGEHNLLKANGHKWGASDAAVRALQAPKLSWGRGFLNAINCPLQAWLGYGPEVVRLHPIQLLTITDREPYPSYHDSPLTGEPVTVYSWGFGEISGETDDITQAILPSHVFQRFLKENDNRAYFSSREKAVECLGKILLEIARE